MVDVAMERFGHLHVAFNNAGIFKASYFEAISEGDIDDLLNTNVKSLAFCFKYQVKGSIGNVDAYDGDVSNVFRCVCNLGCGGETCMSVFGSINVAATSIEAL